MPGTQDTERKGQAPGEAPPGGGEADAQGLPAESALKAEGELEQLARELDKTHPGAAASLRVGMAETLTVLRLGVPPTLARTLRSTNTIESMIGICREHSKNASMRPGSSRRPGTSTTSAAGSARRSGPIRSMTPSRISTSAGASKPHGRPPRNNRSGMDSRNQMEISPQPILAPAVARQAGPRGAGSSASCHHPSTYSSLSSASPPRPCADHPDRAPRRRPNQPGDRRPRSVRGRIRAGASATFGDWQADGPVVRDRHSGPGRRSGACSGQAPGVPVPGWSRAVTKRVSRSAKVWRSWSVQPLIARANWVRR